MSHTTLTLVAQVPTPRDFILGQLLRDIRKDVRQQFWAEGSGEDAPTIRKASVRTIIGRVLLERCGGNCEQYEEYLLAAGRIQSTLDRHEVEGWLHLFPWLTGRPCDYLLGHALAVIAAWLEQDLLADADLETENRNRRRRRRTVRPVTG
jgi:hypothetical protein